MHEEKRIVLAGGSGLLGRLLTRYFIEQGHRVVVLTRAPRLQGPVRQVGWDGDTLGAWTRELEGAEAVINLAGQSVDCRYNRRNRRLILESRLEPTRILGEAIARCARPPGAWLNASTATIYRHSFDRLMDEATGVIAATPEAKDAFSLDVARAWEETLEAAPTPGTRKVALRTAMVLTQGKNSVLPVLRRLARLGLGGAMAGGRQFVSWIHEADFCRAVGWILDHHELGGPVNLAAPGPVTNRELMRLLRRLLGVPVGLPAPGWLLEIGAFLLGTETELVVKSRRVVPGRLLASGFRFRFPAIEEALRDLLIPGPHPRPKIMVTAGWAPGRQYRLDRTKPLNPGPRFAGQSAEFAPPEEIVNPKGLASSYSPT